MNEYKTKIVSGPIASFSDGIIGSTCKEVICDIHTEQDLHDYDKPWAGGCNVNQWKPISGTHRGIIFTPQDDGTIAISGTMESDGWPMVSEDYTLASFGVSIGDSLSVYSDGECQAVVRFLDSNSAQISQITSGNTGTVPADTVTIRLIQIGKDGATAPVTGDVINTVGKFEVDISSTAVSEWLPWANMCPIISQGTIVLYQSGKNLLDWNKYVSATSSYGVYSDIQEDGSIRCHGTITNTSFNVTSRLYNIIKKEPRLIFSITDKTSRTPYLTGYSLKNANLGIIVKISANYSQKTMSSRTQVVESVRLGVSGITANTEQDFIIKPMLEVSDETLKSEWEPYIGPSERSSINMPAKGQNLLSMVTYEGGKYNPTVGDVWHLTKRQIPFMIYPDGSYVYPFTSTGVHLTVIVPITSPGTYRRSFKIVRLNGTCRFTYGVLDKDFKVLSKANATVSTEIGSEYTYSQYSSYTNPDYKYIYLVFTNYSGTNNRFKIIEPQVTEGSLQKPYEPFNGVYEGTYSTNGSITRTYNAAYYDGSEDENWSLSTWNNMYRYFIVIPDAYSVNGLRTGVESNLGKYHSSSNSPGTTFISGYNGQARLFFVPPQTITTLADFKLWLASNPMQVKYKLAEPETITGERKLLTLVDSEVNNIYCDTGDVSVEYYDSKTEPIVEQYFIKGTTLTNIADAIRTVKGTSDPIEVEDFIDEIDGMEMPLPPAEEVEF